MSVQAKVLSPQNMIGSFTSPSAPADVIFGPNSGWADGTYVKVEQVEATVQSMQGAGGEVAHVVRKHAMMTKVTFTLMQTAVENALMEIIYAARATGTILFKDLGGTWVLKMSGCIIERHPASEQGIKTTERQWVVIGIADIWFDGGNPPA